MSLRRSIRSVIPESLRIALALGRRSWRDNRARPRFALPRSNVTEGCDYQVVQVVQEIKTTAFIEGKLTNIRLGAQRLDRVIVAPGEIFSFWKLVGRPWASSGFEIGRSIRGGIVTGERGGGLCQVSGIIYEAGLRAGLVPLERFPHSRDLYVEQERFTPLGLDATVVWPYKDLRLANPYSWPVQFRIGIRDMTIVASVHAPSPLAPCDLAIERTDQDGSRHVRVRRRAADRAEELLTDDIYSAGD